MGLIIIMALAGFIGWFLKDATGYPYHAYGLVWWATAVFITFTLGLLYYALFVLPIPGNEGWAEGLRLLVRNYIKPPPRVEKEPRRRKKQENPLPTHLQELPASFKYLGSGTVRSHHVLALIKGGSFARPAGPGFVILFKNEVINQIIDVRPHNRMATIKANTRDGIPLEMPIFLTFRVWQHEETIQPGTIPYHFDPEAIFHVNYAGSIADKENHKPWSEIIIPIATDLFITEIAGHSLDELYERDSEGQGPLTEINQRVKRNLERNERLIGIEIISAGCGQISLPDSVRQQRLKAWQAQWQREILMKKAKGESEAELSLKRARARAQIEIIENITRSITHSRHHNVNLTEVVALRMITALEDAVANVSEKALVPQPVLTSMVESSRQMLRWMDSEKDKQDE